MRIAGGIHRGRKLFAPEGMNTRPTSDRVREALFNIIAHHEWGEDLPHPLREGFIIDGFAGTGALGLEALSRGAAHAVFVERDRNALDMLRKNIANLKCEEQTTIIGMDITRLSPRENIKPATLVFLDPPYKKGLIPPALASLKSCGYLSKDTLLCLETAKNEILSLEGCYTHLFTRVYGDTEIHFYKAQ